MIDPDLLRKSPFFSELCDEAELAALAAGAELLTFPSHYVLMSEGDFGSAMFVILDGQVSVSVDAPHKRHKEVAHLGAGDLVGEMALMTGDRRRATVTTDTDVTAIRISKTGFETLLAHSPLIAERLEALLARRGAELDEAAATPDRSSIGDRLADAVRRLTGTRTKDGNA